MTSVDVPSVGLFDPLDMQPYAQIGPEVVDSPEHQALALQVCTLTIEGGRLDNEASVDFNLLIKMKMLCTTVFCIWYLSDY